MKKFVLDKKINRITRLHIVVKNQGGIVPLHEDGRSKGLPLENSSVLLLPTEEKEILLECPERRASRQSFDIFQPRMPENHTQLRRCTPK